MNDFFFIHVCFPRRHAFLESFLHLTKAAFLQVYIFHGGHQRIGAYCQDERVDTNAGQ